MDNHEKKSLVLIIHVAQLRILQHCNIDCNKPYTKRYFYIHQVPAIEPAHREDKISLEKTIAIIRVANLPGTTLFGPKILAVVLNPILGYIKPLDKI